MKFVNEVVNTMTFDTFSETFQGLLRSTNNCSAGCACIDDRYEMTLARVAKWKASVGFQKTAFLISELEKIVNDANLNIDLLEEMTNLSFMNDAKASAWLTTWISLLKDENLDTQTEGPNSWLDQGLSSTLLPKIDFTDDMLDIDIKLNGQVDWSNDNKSWQTLAQTPLKSKIPGNLYYRFTAEPGITDEELQEPPFERFAPGLIDLRFIECNSLTDDCIPSLAKIENLVVLSLNSLQLSGTNLHLLGNLKNLKYIDLSGSKNISNDSIERLMSLLPGLQFFKT